MLAGLPRSAGAIAARRRARSTGTQPSGCSFCTQKCEHERGVGDVSWTFGRRPQLQRPQAAHARGCEAEFTQVRGWDTSSNSCAGDSAVEESDKGDSAVEGSEEHFDESEHVDGFAAEERSTDGEEVDESEGEDGRGPEGSDFAAEEGYEEDVRGPEESDFAAEEGYEEGGPDAEGGHEEVWDEVQEALSTMGHEEYDETAEADLCAGSQASRPSSAASSQASVLS